MKDTDPFVIHIPYYTLLYKKIDTFFVSFSQIPNANYII